MVNLAAWSTRPAYEKILRDIDRDYNVKLPNNTTAHFYANSAMGPILSSKFVRPVTVGIMDEEDFETVRMEAQPFRPLARCKKNIRSRKVIVSPDCVFLDDKHRVNTFGDTLSIEIKPKLGYHGGKNSEFGFNICQIGFQNRSADKECAAADVSQGRRKLLKSGCAIYIFASNSVNF